MSENTGYTIDLRNHGGNNIWMIKTKEPLEIVMDLIENYRSLDSLIHTNDNTIMIKFADNQECREAIEKHIETLLFKTMKNWDGGEG